MTERKPPQMKFNTWIDQQVAEAERRGVFDNLPGAGKPLKLRPGAADGDYGQAWIRDYAQREGVPAEEMLPTPLRLRREIERLAETAGEFRSEEEVISRANDTEYGLVAYVYTRDLSRGLRVSEQLDFGMIGLNRGLVSDPAAPFGGVKQSGLGREGAHEGLMEFLETQYISVTW